MRLRTCGFLCITLLVGGCMAGQEGTYVAPGVLPNAPPPPPVAEGATIPGSRIRVALLAPMTGVNAVAGADLVRATQIAFAEPQAPTLDVKDTGSTPQGAAEAARQALATGDTLLLGPLTSAETAAVAPVAEQLHVPVLAFTSDRTQAQPGVWVLGLTPRQQVDRLVAALQAQGKSRIAAILPQSDLGTAMGQALGAAAAAAALPPPQIQTYGAGMGAVTQAVEAASDYADRRGPIDAKIRAAKEAGDHAAVRAAEAEARQGLPPPPFDALLLGDDGTPLAELATLLPFYDVSGVQMMGPALWAQPQNRAGAGAITQGAWYADFDPASRGAFSAAFSGKFGAPPSVLADVAYDAASIARVTAESGGPRVSDALTRPGGFTGANGTLVLLPDGTVRRALAVFQIDGAGETVASPAPAALAPAS